MTSTTFTVTLRHDDEVTDWTAESLREALVAMSFDIGSVTELPGIQVFAVEQIHIPGEWTPTAERLQESMLALSFDVISVEVTA